MLKNGELKKAVEILNKSIDSNKDDPSLLTNLAIVKAELGENIIQKKYTYIYKTTSDQFLGYYNYSLFLYNQNRFDESLKVIKKARNIVPHAQAIEIEKILESSNLNLAALYLHILNR